MRLALLAGVGFLALGATAASAAPVIASLPVTCDPNDASNCTRAITVVNPDGSNISGGSGGGSGGSTANQRVNAQSGDFVTGSIADIGRAVNPATGTVNDRLNQILNGLGSIGGTVNVGNFPSSQTVSGSVSILNLPANQTVSGTVNVGNFPTSQAVTGTVAVSSLPATAPLAPVSYTLLTNATTTGIAQAVAGGGYIWGVSGTFNGATVTLAATDPSGNMQTVATLTAPGGVLVNVGQGSTVQVIVTGSPSGLNSKLAGLGGPVTSPPALQAVDTILKSNRINRSAVVGFQATASAASSASTTLNVTSTSNFTNQAGTLTGIPMVGQIVAGTGITTGTTIVSLTANSATSYTLTLSATATVASGAAVTSGGPQVIIPINPLRRGYSVQNQSGGNCGLNDTGPGTLGADSTFLYSSATAPVYFTSEPTQVGTNAISELCAVPAAPNNVKEFQ